MAKAHEGLVGGRQCRPHRVEIVELSTNDLVPTNGVDVTGVDVTGADVTGAYCVVGWMGLRL